MLARRGLALCLPESFLFGLQLLRVSGVGRDIRRASLTFGALLVSESLRRLRRLWYAVVVRERYSRATDDQGARRDYSRGL